ncbi:MAG: hypothetical protein L3K23_09480 [Thermoplasmata archaeon]|nr:hypothetical protein [Thermoplasmata archaeon]
MHPVPDWIVHVTLPRPEEHHLQFWGPVSATTEGQLSAGYLVLTDQRFLFLRSAGRRHSEVTEGFELPLEQLRRVTAIPHGVEVHLRVNDHEFRAIVPGDESAGDLAHSIRSTIVEVRRQRISDLREESHPDSGSGRRSSSSGAAGCRYCGTLFPSSTVRCPSCGAPRKS